MSGNVTPYVDFLTTSDSGENNSSSIQPITDGEKVNQTILRRPDENLRKRTEVLRSQAVDSQFLQNADRALLLAGPGTVTWNGSTTASQNGIPVISDNLWILPMLTPGSAQTPPVPPVASKLGTLHLKRASDNMNSILVTSARRSYAAGDQINITVSAGGVYSCTLDTEDTGVYRRTIKIVATPSTTLGTVITSLNGLTPPSPDNTQLVTAALEGGALNADLILDSQARQFVSGNYDGEGHTITPANLASFFSSNPSQALAEGDTLCAQFAMLVDTASTGGRRQAIPENTNTTITAGMFFNSRVQPEKLVNALPICKVINGSLVFLNGQSVPAGSVGLDLTGRKPAATLLKNGSFDYGLTSGTHRHAVAGWEITQAVNGGWRLVSSGMESGAKCLSLNVTASGVDTYATISQNLEVPIQPGARIRYIASVKQLIAPSVLGGTYIQINYGDADSVAASQLTDDFQTAGTDASFRHVDFTFTVPAGKYVLKSIDIKVEASQYGSTGNALLVDNVQMYLIPTTSTNTDAAEDVRLSTSRVDGVIIEDPSTYQIGQLAALLRFIKATPTNEGAVYLERKDQTSGLPPALQLAGRLYDIGRALLGSNANNALPRLSMPHSDTRDFTLLFETHPESLGLVTIDLGFRMFATSYDGSLGAGDNALSFTINAKYDGTNWSKDTNSTAAYMLQMRPDGMRLFCRPADVNTTWTSTQWIQTAQFGSPNTVASGSPPSYYAPHLALFDAAGNRRVGLDHLGFPRVPLFEENQNWVAPMFAAWTESSSGSASNTVLQPGDGASPGMWLQQLTTANAEVAAMYSSYRPLSGPIYSDQIAVLEFEVDSTAIAGTAAAVYQAGFVHDEGAEPSTEDFIKIYKTAANANWIFKTYESLGAGTDVNTGVVANGYQKFRIEVHGSGAPGGAKAICFIDGVLRAVITTNLPGGQQMCIITYLRQTGAVAKSVAVSPMRFRAFRASADPAL